MDIGEWLRSLDLGRYEEVFRDNEIDEQILPSLTTEDLREIGVGPLAIVANCCKPSRHFRPATPSPPLQKQLPPRRRIFPAQNVVS